MESLFCLLPSRLSLRPVTGLRPTVTCRIIKVDFSRNVNRLCSCWQGLAKMVCICYKEKFSTGRRKTLGTLRGLERPFWNYPRVSLLSFYPLLILQMDTSPPKYFLVRC
jgi:hypothetical protein